MPLAAERGADRREERVLGEDLGDTLQGAEGDHALHLHQVAELPDTVNVTVSVYADGALTFSSVRTGASRLAVFEQPPEIVIESGSGTTSGRLEISLTPRLLIRDTLGRPDA